MSAPESPVILSLLGPSGSGKTTLAEHLVRRWTSRGLSAGFVKHASHGFEMDREGKDTRRVSDAGGAGVAVTGPQGTAYLDADCETSPRAVVDRFFSTCDVVVLEGFREAALPAVILAGDAQAAEFVDLARGEILAVVAQPDTLAAAAAKGRQAACFAPGDRAALAAHLDLALDLPSSA